MATSWDPCTNTHENLIGQPRVDVQPFFSELGMFHFVETGDTLQFTAAVRRVARVYSVSQDPWRPLDFTTFGICRIVWGASVAAEITWSSSAGDIATVEQGTVVGRRPGLVDITARAASLGIAETRQVEVFAASR